MELSAKNQMEFSAKNQNDKDILDALETFVASPSLESLCKINYPCRGGLRLVPVQYRFYTLLPHNPQPLCI